MHRYCVILCFVSAFLLTGCTYEIDKRYLALSNDTRVPAESFVQVVISSKPLQLRAGETVRGELTEASPLLAIEANRSVFELFSFSIDSVQQFKVTVDGILGDGAVAPQLVIVDELGGVLPTRFEREHHRPTWTESASIRATISGNALRKGLYYVVVMADNRLEGKPVGVVGEIPIYPSPFGPFRITLTVTPE